MIKTLDASQAPSGRSASAARSMAEFNEALSAARSIPAGKVVVVSFTDKQLETIGGKNPLNAFAQTLRVQWRKDNVTDRIAYTVADKDNGGPAVCIRQGVPRKNTPREKKADGAKAKAK